MRGLRRRFAARTSYDIIDLFVGRSGWRSRSATDVCHDCSGFVKFGKFWGLFVLGEFNGFFAVREGRRFFVLRKLVLREVERSAEGWKVYRLFVFGKFESLVVGRDFLEFSEFVFFCAYPIDL